MVELSMSDPKINLNSLGSGKNDRNDIKSLDVDTKSVVFKKQI